MKKISKLKRSAIYAIKNIPNRITHQNYPPVCECGKKCVISARFIDKVRVWACLSCVVYSSALVKRVKKHIRKLMEEEIINSESDVRDHCHITGKHRGLAHQSCNINYRLTDKIPVIFHNLRGYDSHFIMKEIGKFKQNINVIPNNMEKYMSFMLAKYSVFIDSFQKNHLNIHQKNFKKKNLNL